LMREAAVGDAAGAGGTEQVGLPDAQHAHRPARGGLPMMSTSHWSVATNVSTWRVSCTRSDGRHHPPQTGVTGLPCAHARPRPAKHTARYLLRAVHPLDRP